MLNDQETAQFDFSNFSPARAEDLAPGMFLGKEKNYRLEKFLGAGGMGHAWLAAEIEDGVELRKVVCKVLPALIQREKAEMEKVLKTFHRVQPLNHPNICPIYSLRSDPVYGYFFVMGYADCGSLWDWLQEQPDYANGLPVSQVVEVLRPVAQALDYAHEMGIMHRDVKPQNILFVSRRDQKIPWLIDFGISAQIHSTTTQTLGESGNSGTPAYMAPEQCQSRLQDGRTDQYALGVLVYQLLSGRLPFEADNLMALMNRIVYDPVPSLTNVSAQVNAAVRRAMAKDRKDRFASCEEFIEALAGEKSFKPSLWSVVRPIVKALKKYQWPLIAGVLALLVVWFSVFNPSGRRPESIPEPSGAPGPNVADVVDEADFEMDGSTLTKYTGHAEDLVIPAFIKGHKVTKIGIDAFKGCKTLKTLTIPEGVTEIMRGAFLSNPMLTTVILPDSVETIGEAFASCQELKQWIISPSNPHFKSDGIALFTKDGKILVACSAAAGEYRIPDGVTEIKSAAFGGCKDLESIIIPDSVREICPGAFTNCGFLKQWSISPDHPYFKSEGIALLTKDGKKLISCPSVSGEYRIPEGVTEIDNCAFMACGFFSVVIPEGVTKIGNLSLSYCNSLEYIVIPETVTKMNNAILACPHLTSVVIPGSVTEFGKDEFKDCPNLTIYTSAGSKAEEYARKNNIPVRDIKEWDPVAAAIEADFEMDGSTLKRYTGHAENLVIPAVIKGHKVTKIGVDAFRGCRTLKTLTIPEGVTEIMRGAFLWNPLLTTVILPDSVETIGEAFAYCQELKQWIVSPSNPHFKSDGIALFTKDGKILVACPAATGEYRIPDGVTEIRSAAFSGCTGLESIIIPDSVREICPGAFTGCGFLKQWTISSDHPYFKSDGIALLTKDGKKLISCPGATGEYRIPEGVTEIDNCVFMSCDSFSVTIPEGVTEIGKQAFAYSKSLTFVVIPEGVTEIGNGAFSECTNLTSVIIPESVTEFGNQVFNNCPNLTIYTPAGSKAEEYARKNNIPVKDIKAWDPNAVSAAIEADFEMDGSTLTRYNGSAAKLVIPAFIKGHKVTKIGNAAFRENKTLKSLTIPEGVTEIGRWAFLGQPLRSVTIPDSLKEIEPAAFAYCPDLKQWIISPGNSNFKSDGIALLTKDGKKLVACPGETGEYQIPDGVMEIESGAFAGCRDLLSIIIPDSVREICPGAFTGCGFLKQWSISSTHPYFKSEGIALLSKDGKILVACPSAEGEYRIPEGVTEIVAYVFSSCDSLTSIVIPEGMTEIGDQAFASCKSLKSVVIPEGVMEIGSQAFWKSPNLTSIVIPESVTEFGNEVFKECPNLTIHAPARSKAEEYAKKNGIPFEAR